jgi:hypothetical protein
VTRPSARPVDHQPHRPGWTCCQCGADWPCETYRDHLRQSLQGDRSAIQSLMATHYSMMLAELREEAAVYDRLFGWARHEGVRRPPGGPW